MVLHSLKASLRGIVKNTITIQCCRDLISFRRIIRTSRGILVPSAVESVSFIYDRKISTKVVAGRQLNIPIRL